MFTWYKHFVYRLKTICLQGVNAGMLSSISCCADSVCTVLVFKSIRHPDHMKQVAAAEPPAIFPGERLDEEVKILESRLYILELAHLG